MLELNHLRVFYEVARIGRFAEAARILHISQSALSRSVALLEEKQNVKLFERSQKGVRLTPIGQEVFSFCEHLFQTVEQIEKVCSGRKDICEGLLRFGATDHVTNYLLLDPLQNMRRHFPRVVPSVFTGTPDDIINRVLMGEAEFGLMFSKVPLPQLHFDHLREEKMSLVVSMALWQKCRGPSNQKTLSKILERWGYISSIGAHLERRPSRVLLELFGEMPRIGFEANGQEAQKRVCLGGGGIAYLSRFMVEDEIKSGLLYEIEVENPHSFKLWMARKKGKSLSLASQKFIDLIKC